MAWIIWIENDTSRNKLQTNGDEIPWHPKSVFACIGCPGDVVDVSPPSPPAYRSYTGAPWPGWAAHWIPPARNSIHRYPPGRLSKCPGWVTHWLVSTVTWHHIRKASQKMVPRDRTSWDEDGPNWFHQFSSSSCEHWTQNTFSVHCLTFKNLKKCLRPHQNHNTWCRCCGTMGSWADWLAYTMKHGVYHTNEALLIEALGKFRQKRVSCPPLAWKPKRTKLAEKWRLCMVLPPVPLSLVYFLYQ